MKRSGKKTFSDINVFYPNEYDYEADVDYDPNTFNSKFTLELSKIYTDYIFDQLGEKTGKVFAWNVEITDIPLLIETISREDTAFMFIYTKDDKCIDIVSAILTLLKLATKASVSKNAGITNLDMNGVIYIGVDKIPIDISKVSKKVTIAAVILINTEEEDELNLPF